MGLAGIASFMVSGTLVILTMAALQYCQENGYFGEDGIDLGLHSLASASLTGAVIGAIIYMCLRVFLFGAGPVLFRWSCQLPSDTEETKAFQIQKEIFIFLGFITAFIILFSLARLGDQLDIGIFLVPAFASLFPLYNTIVLPWLAYFRSPRLSSRNIVEIETWLEELGIKYKLPRFRVVVQEGTLVNAMAFGGLFRSLVVIGGGILDGMSPIQVKAVLAHEIGHAVRRDVTRRLLPLAVIGGTFYLLCLQFFVNPYLATEEIGGILVGVLLASLFALVFIALIPGFFMRRIELQTDRLAVEFLGDGELLVDALTRLAELSGQSMDEISWSHPTMQTRIDAIRALSRSKA